jgi:hypothetical protein
MHTMTFKRLLEKMGFTHISGWVKSSDAPAIKKKIAGASAEVNRIRNSESVEDDD